MIIAFNVQLYNLFEQQKSTLSAIKDKQDVEAEFNSNKFKYQADQIERVSKDLEDAKEQIQDQSDALAQQKVALAAQKDDLAAQKDSLVQEAQKRQELENNSKAIQLSLVDIKAGSDAIKQDMKEWQKAYVTVLAELEKKMDSSQTQMKSVETNLQALNIPELKQNIESLKTDVEKISQASQANTSNSTVTPEKKVEEIDYHSQ